MIKYVVYGILITTRRY